MVLLLPSSLMNILWNDKVVTAYILSTMNRELKRECGLILYTTLSLVGGSDEDHGEAQSGL
jgi:hypothetical protein